MEWQFCNVCNKVVDEYEDKCYWCGTPKAEIEAREENSKYDKSQLKLNFGDPYER
jgi:hypothetical protein